MTTTARPLGSDPKGINMTVQSDNERNTVVAEDGHVVAVFNIGVTGADGGGAKADRIKERTVTNG